MTPISDTDSTGTKSTSKHGSFKRTVSRKELPFQDQLLKSAKAEGGYGRKVAHFQLRGISDLLLQMPSFSMAQVECKDLGLKKAGFDVISGITEHQKDHIEALNRAAGGLVAFYAFHVQIGEGHRAVFLDHYVERFRYADMWGWGIDSPDGKSWPGLTRIWQQLGVMHVTRAGGLERPG